MVDVIESPVFIYFIILKTLHCLLQLRNLNSLPNSVSVFKYSRLGWIGYAERMQNCSEDAKSWSRNVAREKYAGHLEIGE
jgi:hypothetical protein